MEVMDLKIRSPKVIGFSCFLCWILHLLMNTCILKIVTGPLNRKNLKEETNYRVCSCAIQDRFDLFYAITYFSPDFVSLVFMVPASGSKVFVLHRHKQRVQHIHNHRLSSGLFHEARRVNFRMTSAAIPGHWMVNISVPVVSCFTAFNPFVLISSDTWPAGTAYRRTHSPAAKMTTTGKTPEDSGVLRPYAGASFLGNDWSKAQARSAHSILGGVVPTTPQFAAP
ncbi:PREDICTED: vomeronasal type-1 receptor 1 [Mandrillus leucophaeus]|uniref:vomeronasal type-1 receptor 1 n=1 Tax=Mandrillus leucophaeus TaxID=9568 RepID=UPI0005F49435|nr:PREDICTED: vomeronasal type-1 receptor 1 [Mandrillus leucophaeus]